VGRTAALMTKLSRTFTPIRRRESDSACDSEREGGSAELWEIEFVGIWCCVLCVCMGMLSLWSASGGARGTWGAMWLGASSSSLVYTLFYCNIISNLTQLELVSRVDE
jgi:hypothetical protein